MHFYSLDTLLKKLTKDRVGKSVVFTNGCFDILHVGHVRYLQEAKECGDLLVVALNSDKSVKKLKGNERPVQTEQDRAEILAALKAVDYTVIFEEDTPLKVIQQIKPDILVKGGDWPIEKIVGAQDVIRNGGEVRSLQFVDGRSTSNLVNKIKTL